MSEQGFGEDWREAAYQILDAGADPAAAGQQLQALLAQVQGGAQHPGQPGDPGGGSALVPEATPYPTPEPAGSFTELLQQVPDVQRAVASGDPEAAQEATWALAEAYNRTADQHVREQQPDLYGPQAATDDAGLQELNDRVQAAYVDPGSLDEGGLYRLVEQTNQTIDGLRDQHEQGFDAMEQQRAAAERARAAQRRKEQPTIEQLRRLVAQYEAGGQPAGGR